MKYGSLVRLSLPEEAYGAFTRLKKSGFDCCQLVYKPEEYTEEAAKTIRDAASSVGIDISAMFAGFRDSFTTWDIYDGYKNAGIFSRAYGAIRIAYLKKAVQFASLCGIHDVLIHAGFVPNDPFSAEYLRTVKIIRGFASYCKKLGIDLLLETGGESPVTLLRLIKDAGTGNVFVNLDTANLIMYGYGNPVDAVYTLKGNIRSLHAKDGLPPTDPKKLGVETEFGKGFVDFPRVFEELRKIGFDGAVVLEREIADGNETEIINTLRKIKSLTAEKAKSE